MKSVACAVAVMLLGNALPQVANAAPDADTRLNQRFWVQLVGFRADSETTVRVDDQSMGAQGSQIQLENDLGLAKQKTVPALLLGARFSERWRGEFEYFALNRQSNQFPIVRSYLVNGTRYDTSALMDTQFDSQVARLSAGYSLWRTDSSEFGAVAGLHVTRFKFAVAGQGTTPLGVVTLQRETADGTAPLPTVGVYGTYTWSPKWAVNGRADFFSLKRGDYDGRLINLQTNVFYRFTPQVSVGVGYRYDDYKLSVQRDQLSAQIKYRFRGPQVLIDVGF